MRNNYAAHNAKMFRQRCNDRGNDAFVRQTSERTIHQRQQRKRHAQIPNLINDSLAVEAVTNTSLPVSW